MYSEESTDVLSEIYKECLDYLNSTNKTDLISEIPNKKYSRSSAVEKFHAPLIHTFLMTR